MTKANKIWLSWLTLTALSLYFLAAISGILLPFVAGIIIAYFLRPAAAKLESLGIKRTISALIIMLSFVVVILVFSLTIVPILYHQSIGLIKHLPEYIKYFDAVWV